MSKYHVSLFFVYPYLKVCLYIPCLSASDILTSPPPPPPPQTTHMSNMIVNSNSLIIPCRGIYSSTYLPTYLSNCLYLSIYPSTYLTYLPISFCFRYPPHAQLTTILTFLRRSRYLSSIHGLRAFLFSFLVRFH